VVVASHGLLDTLTDGGLGCALFWPFDTSRYFAPWRPIPVSPLGLGYLSPYGAFVATVELILFSPLVVFALRRTATTSRSVGRGALMVWLVLVWLIGSTDPVRQALVRWIVRAETEYANGYSEQRFATISPGMTPTEVTGVMGEPMAQWWEYPPVPTRECRVVRFANDRVTTWAGFERCTPPGVQLGMAPDTVLRQIGPPATVVWEYSRSRTTGWFHAINVYFANGRVRERERRWSPGEPP
jgi:hypothetical protein